MHSKKRTQRKRNMPAFGWKWNACLSSFISGAVCRLFSLGSLSADSNLHKMICNTSNEVSQCCAVRACGCFYALCYSSCLHCDVQWRKWTIAIIHVSHLISGCAHFFSWRPALVPHAHFSVVLSIVYAGFFPICFQFFLYCHMICYMCSLCKRLIRTRRLFSAANDKALHCYKATEICIYSSIL